MNVNTGFDPRARYDPEAMAQIIPGLSDEIDDNDVDLHHCDGDDATQDTQDRDSLFDFYWGDDEVHRSRKRMFVCNAQRVILLCLTFLGIMAMIAVGVVVRRDDFDAEQQKNDINIDNEEVKEKYSGDVSAKMNATSAMAEAIEIAQACGTAELETVRGRSSCQHQCQDHMCCFDSNPAFNCLMEHADDSCTIFAPCENLLRTTQSEQDTFSLPSHSFGDDPLNLHKNDTHMEYQVDEVKVYVRSMCTSSSISTTVGFRKCHNACQPFLCCFSSPNDNTNNIDAITHVENCSNDHQVHCEAYWSCNILVHQKEPINDNKSDEETKAMVDTSCEPSQLATPEGLKNCHDVCREHLCCFVPDGMKSNCVDVIGPHQCSLYSSCQNLILSSALPDQDVKEEEDQVLTTPEKVKEACDNQDPSKESSCHALCDTRRCCFLDGPGNCYETDKAYCDEFEPCQHKSNNNNNNIIAQNPNQPTIAEQIGIQCSSASLSTLAGTNQCSQLCQPYLCCFSQDANENCHDDHPALCQKYSSCQVLVQSTNTSPPLGDDTKIKVQNACNIQSKMIPPPSSTTDLLQSCRDICSDHLCCFASQGMKSNCVDVKGSDECDIFEACSILISDDDDDDQGSSSSSSSSVAELSDFYDDNVNNVCVKESILRNEGERNKCSTLCHKRRCCFEPGLGNCYATDKEWCDEYQACEVLQQVQNQDEDNNNSNNKSNHISPSVQSILDTDIGFICTKDAMDDEVEKDKCSDLCHRRWCCFTQGDGNCYVNNEEWCDEFERCKVLLESENENFENVEQDKPEDESSTSSMSDTDIGVMCMRDAIRDEDGRKKCEELCHRRECCFVKHDEGNCYMKNTEWCDDFQPCEILQESNNNNNVVDLGNYESNNEPEDEVMMMQNSSTTTNMMGESSVTIEAVSEACANSNANNISTSCRSICEAAECCFDLSFGPCDHEFPCQIYVACDIAFHF